MTEGSPAAKTFLVYFEPGNMSCVNVLHLFVGPLGVGSQSDQSCLWSSHHPNFLLWSWRLPGPGRIVGGTFLITFCYTFYLC